MAQGRRYVDAWKRSKLGLRPFDWLAPELDVCIAKCVLAYFIDVPWCDGIGGAMRNHLGFVLCLLFGATNCASAAPPEPQFGPHKFESYPVSTYRGPSAQPDFVHGKKFWGYRTRIRDAAKSGINFGGHYVFAQIGCGTGCDFFFMIDVRSGRIFDFPLKGERIDATQLVIRPDSRLIKAWSVDLRDNGDHVCLADEFLFDGKVFKPLWHDSLPGECPWG